MLESEDDADELERPYFDEREAHKSAKRMTVPALKEALEALNEIPEEGNKAVLVEQLVCAQALKALSQAPPAAAAATAGGSGANNQTDAARVATPSSSTDSSQRDGSRLFTSLNDDELQLVTGRLQNPLKPAAFASLALSSRALLQMLKPRLRKLRIKRKHADLVLRKVNNPTFLAFEALDRLRWARVDMTIRDCESLASLLNEGWVRARPLFIENCPIGKAGEAYLFKTLQPHALSQLTHLLINHSGIHLNALAHALPRMPNLLSLHLAGNTNIGDAGLKRLADAIGRGALQLCTMLNLAGCNVGNEGIGALADAIRDTPGALQSLHTLWLGRDSAARAHAPEIGDAGFSALCSLLPTRLPALRVLSVRGSSALSQHAVASLSALLEADAAAAPLLRDLFLFPATNRSRANPPPWMAAFEARGMYVDGQH
jgi:hypothetical protein